MRANGSIKLALTSGHTFTEEQLASIRALGYEYDIIPDREKLPAEQAALYEVVVCMGLLRVNDLADFTNLKFVHSIATGVEQLPLDKLKGTGILVSKGKDLYSIPMAEWAVSKLLEVYKRSRLFGQLQREHVWKGMSTERGGYIMDELWGKRVAILGTGDVAAVLVEILRGFEVASIVGMNSNGRLLPGYDACYGTAQLDEVLDGADIVCILAPLTRETEGQFDDAVISRMKPGSILVNMSRGKIVRTDAVLRALESGHLRHFIGDVFETEPLPADSPLWEREDVSITPHNSFISNMRPQRLYELIYRNLKLYAEGGTPGDAVDLTKGY